MATDDHLYINTIHSDNPSFVNLVRQTLETSEYIETERVGSHTIAIRETEEREREREHSFEVGDYAIDDMEPTPSPEANTVRIVGLVDQRADEFVVDEDGKTIAEYDNNRYYPDDDLIVAGVYPNMGDSDTVWHFPESRLRKA